MVEELHDLDESNRDRQQEKLIFQDPGDAPGDDGLAEYLRPTPVEWWLLA